MEQDSDFDFDFDHWAKLAKEQPEEFERQRQLVIEEIIAKSPHSYQKRMQGLQWQIDQIRLQANNPMAACIKISSMMWDTVLGDRGLVEAIEKLNTPELLPDQECQEDAQILQFGRQKPDQEPS